MLKELIKLANSLDAEGLTKEADFVDGLTKNSWELPSLPSLGDIHDAYEDFTTWGDSEEKERDKAAWEGKESAGDNKQALMDQEAWKDYKAEMLADLEAAKWWFDEFMEKDFTGDKCHETADEMLNHPGFLVYHGYGWSNPYNDWNQQLLSLESPMMLGGQHLNTDYMLPNQKVCDLGDTVRVKTYQTEKALTPKWVEDRIPVPGTYTLREIYLHLNESIRLLKALDLSSPPSVAEELGTIPKPTPTPAPAPAPEPRTSTPPLTPDDPDFWR